MATSRISKIWALVIGFLVIIIVIGGIVIWSRYTPASPVEISIPQPQQWLGKIYIDGAVNSPGFYPLQANDSVDSLIRAAGGADASANLSGLELHVPGGSEGQGAQQIDINRAEAWLLQALPGIGETLAKRIVDYRQQNGLFNNTNELLKVPGVGATVYERIKGLITVAGR